MFFLSGEWVDRARKYIWYISGSVAKLNEPKKRPHRGMGKGVSRYKVAVRGGLCHF